MLARTTVGLTVPSAVGARQGLRPPLPSVEGFRHAWIGLPTGVRLHVAETGPRDGAPLLALHGWPQHWYMWREVARFLGERGFRVICPDVRGQGWSGWPADGDFRKRCLADDAVAVLDALEIRSAAVLGHDWGGWTAFIVAARSPERVRALMALGIVAPWNRGRAAGWRDIAFAYQPLVAAPVLGPRLVRSRRLMELLMRGSSARGRSWDPRVLREYVEVQRAPDVAHASSRLYRSFLRSEVVRTEAAAPDAVRLPMPVMQIVGREDIVRIRLDRARPPAQADWTVETVAGCGHFIVDECPALVCGRALDFFARASAEGAGPSAA